MEQNPRRRRFKAWFEGAPLHGKTSSELARKRLMEKTGLSAGRVTQLMDEDEPFGERAGRKIAEAFGLVPDFFDRDWEDPAAGRRLTLEQERLLVLWDRLPQRARNRLLGEAYDEATKAAGAKVLLSEQGIEPPAPSLQEVINEVQRESAGGNAPARTPKGSSSDVER
jgi:hypothetical protein